MLRERQERTYDTTAPGHPDSQTRRGEKAHVCEDLHVCVRPREPSSGQPANDEASEWKEHDPGDAGERGVRDADGDVD